jgi:hypothetical protein
MSLMAPKTMNGNATTYPMLATFTMSRTHGSFDGGHGTVERPMSKTFRRSIRT